jgi:hypothetical protein
VLQAPAASRHAISSLGSSAFRLLQHHVAIDRRLAVSGDYGEAGVARNLPPMRHDPESIQVGEPVRVVIPAILSLLVAMPPPAHGTIALAGAGAISCAVYGQDFKRDPLDFGNFFFSWAQGFMSGLNTRHFGTHDTTDLQPASYPPDAQERFIEGYCDQHPLATFVDAVMMLWSDMRKSQGLPAERP